MITKILAQEIFDTAIDCGFDNCGILPLSDLDDYKTRLEERKEKVPQSEQFYININGLTKIKEQYPWAKAVIICTTWLGKYRYPESLQGKYTKAFFLSPKSVPDSKAYQDKLKFENWMTEHNIR